jgi:uncharacterized repeat protein (TIGR01451 family)
VLFAGLYWGGRTTTTSRNQVLFRRPGAGYTTVTGSLTGTPVSGSATTPEAYQMFADVTSLVQAAGAGTYTVANVQTDLGTDRYGAWGLVVVVRDPSQPPRNLTVFDGFGAVQTAGGNTTVDIGVSGFKTPPAGPVNTRVGVIAYEGDLGFNGDTLQLASPPPNFKTLTDPLNPPDNFFNSTISRLGQRVTTKNPDFVNQLGFDADIVSAANIIPNSATSATLRLTTTGETYYPGVVTTAIDLFAPIVDVNKKMTDLNGGVLVPGDIVQIDITTTNSGQDGASAMVLTDPIPANTTFVPGTRVQSRMRQATMRPSSTPRITGCLSTWCRRECQHRRHPWTRRPSHKQLQRPLSGSGQRGHPRRNRFVQRGNCRLHGPDARFAVHPVQSRRHADGRQA